MYVYMYVCIHVCLSVCVPVSLFVCVSYVLLLVSRTNAGLHPNGRLLALPTNTRVAVKAVANTLAYNITATITTVKVV
jgi:hypothetical protein